MICKNLMEKCFYELWDVKNTRANYEVRELLTTTFSDLVKVAIFTVSAKHLTSTFAKRLVPAGINPSIRYHSIIICLSNRVLKIVNDCSLMSSQLSSIIA